MHDPELSSQQARPKPAGKTHFLLAVIVLFLVLHAVAAVWLHETLTAPQIETSKPVTYGD
jgi:cytochrome b561